MEAIVLAGGLGTRLKSVINDIPKPMALINHKPFLEYLLEYLIKNGITRVILSVGYKNEMIKDYFGEQFKSIEIIYSIENEPMGTGGAIKKAINLVKTSDVFILNGDTFFNINLKKMIKKNKSQLIIALKQMNDFDRYGSIELNSKGFISNFEEKSYKKMGYINGGIYLVRKNIFDNFNLSNKFSFERFIEKNYKIINIYGEKFDEYFIDIGIPEDYLKAQKEVSNYI